MGLILDASVFIEAERNRFDLGRLLADSGDDLVAIAAITASELLHGVERAKDAHVRARRQAFVESLVNDFPVLPFGEPEAREHARVWAALAAKGKVIGPYDMLVAATALAHGSTVVTLNQKEFGRVPGLAVMPVDAYGH